MKTYLRKDGVHIADLQVIPHPVGLNECELQNCRICFISLIAFAPPEKEELGNSLGILL